MRSRLIIVCLIAIALIGCDRFTQKHQVGTVAEVSGQKLYTTDLTAITYGWHGEDSARAAEAYVRQWASTILMNEKAQKDLDPAIEDMVRSYRQSLYAHQYEQMLISRHMNKEIDPAEVDSFYTNHSKDYILENTILKGVLVVLPIGTPDQKKLSQWLRELTDDDLERIEKYSYRYATGYQLFLDQWITHTQLQLWLPASLTTNDLIRKMHQQTQLVFEDSVSTYMLQVTDVHFASEPMPLDYAQPAIEKVLLQHRQISFLQEERNKLFEEAVRFKKVKIYEQ